MGQWGNTKHCLTASLPHCLITYLPLRPVPEVAKTVENRPVP